MSVHYLDIHIEKFTYLNLEFNFDAANRDMLKKVKSHGIVLTFDPASD